MTGFTRWLLILVQGPRHLFIHDGFSQLFIHVHISFSAAPLTFYLTLLPRYGAGYSRRCCRLGSSEVLRQSLHWPGKLQVWSTLHSIAVYVVQLPKHAPFQQHQKRIHLSLKVWRRVRETICLKGFRLWLAGYVLLVKTAPQTMVSACW